MRVTLAGRNDSSLTVERETVQTDRSGQMKGRKDLFQSVGLPCGGEGNEW